MNTFSTLSACSIQAGSFLPAKIARLFLAIFKKPRFFKRFMFIFTCALEIASLSCYFLILQKVKEKNCSEVDYLARMVIV
jgi:hypothetical protein